MQGKIKSQTLLLFLIGFATFIFSIFLAPFHVNGDQIHYSAAYEAMEGLNLNDGLIVYQSHIFTNEPVHFFVSWFFANVGMSKNVTMTTFNSILVILFAKILLIRKYPKWLILILIFNSYLMVLFFTLERNKLAFIFIFALILYRKVFLYFSAI